MAKGASSTSRRPSATRTRKTPLRLFSINIQTHLPSASTTRSPSPSPPDNEQRRRERQKWQLIREQQQSIPREQFDAQRHQEERRVLVAEARRKRRIILPDNIWRPDVILMQLAWETVREN
ncbi:hypothetical protein GQ44DRAFT_727615 [Phaeosphaeriaceae sp. PMI808]|nr:hypothetical protein GQ44DRAFT_727615 [Phaeosphaeriaceae sp. PMI808]